MVRLVTSAMLVVFPQEIKFVMAVAVVFCSNAITTLQFITLSPAT